MVMCLGKTSRIEAFPRMYCLTKQVTVETSREKWQAEV